MDARTGSGLTRGDTDVFRTSYGVVQVTPFWGPDEIEEHLVSYRNGRGRFASAVVQPCELGTWLSLRWPATQHRDGFRRDGTFGRA